MRCGIGATYSRTRSATPVAANPSMSSSHLSRVVRATSASSITPRTSSSGVRRRPCRLVSACSTVGRSTGASGRSRSESLSGIARSWPFQAPVVVVRGNWPRAIATIVRYSVTSQARAPGSSSTGATSPHSSRSRACTAAASGDAVTSVMDMTVAGSSSFKGRWWAVSLLTAPPTPAIPSIMVELIESPSGSGTGSWFRPNLAGYIPVCRDPFKNPGQDVTDRSEPQPIPTFCRSGSMTATTRS